MSSKTYIEGYVDGAIGFTDHVGRDDIEYLVGKVLDKNGIKKWWDGIFPDVPTVPEILRGMTPSEILASDDPVLKKALVDRAVDYVSPSYE